MPKKVSNPEAKMVPLSLQILLENTVKHNVVTPSKPLKIEIYEKDNFLIVENNLQPKEVVKKSIESWYSQQIEADSVILNPTRKEFDGDYTLVVFPYTKMAKKAPPVLAEEIGDLCGA